MLVKGEEILDVIPQRPPVVMIDCLYFVSRTSTISGFTVPEHSIFVDGMLFSESGLLENIAQTAAAGMGYSCRVENRKVPVGFIAALKDVQIFRRPVVGSVLRTEVQLQNCIMDISIVRGNVYCEEALLATCEMRLYLHPEE